MFTYKLVYTCYIIIVIRWDYETRDNYCVLSE